MSEGGGSEGGAGGGAFGREVEGLAGGGGGDEFVGALVAAVPGFDAPIGLALEAIEFGAEADAVGEAGGGLAGEEFKGGDLDFAEVIALEAEGIVGGAPAATPLPRDEADDIADGTASDGDEGGQGTVAADPAEDGSHGRFGGVGQFVGATEAEGARFEVARGEVDVGSAEGEAITAGGEAGEGFGEGYAGGAGGDGGEGAPDIGGGEGLGVEGVEMTGATPQPEEDDTAGPGWGTGFEGGL